jgi:hypothetical protein
MGNPLNPALEAWISRKHVRSCHRPPGTYGPDDHGCNTVCNCDEYRAAPIDALRARAADGHKRDNHPGPPDACQSPHDVLCKAVWP